MVMGYHTLAEQTDLYVTRSKQPGRHAVTALSVEIQISTPWAQVQQATLGRWNYRVAQTRDVGTALQLATRERLRRDLKRGAVQVPSTSSRCYRAGNGQMQHYLSAQEPAAHGAFNDGRLPAARLPPPAPPCQVLRNWTCASTDIAGGIKTLTEQRARTVGGDAANALASAPRCRFAVVGTSSEQDRRTYIMHKRAI